MYLPGARVLTVRPFAVFRLIVNAPFLPTLPISFGVDAAPALADSARIRLAATIATAPVALIISRPPRMSVVNLDRARVREPRSGPQWDEGRTTGRRDVLTLLADEPLLGRAQRASRARVRRGPAIHRDRRLLRRRD